MVVWNPRVVLLGGGGGAGRRVPHTRLWVHALRGHPPQQLQIRRHLPAGWQGGIERVGQQQQGINGACGSGSGWPAAPGPPAHLKPRRPGRYGCGRAGRCRSSRCFSCSEGKSRTASAATAAQLPRGWPPVSSPSSSCSLVQARKLMSRPAIKRRPPGCRQSAASRAMTRAANSSCCLLGVGVRWWNLAGGWRRRRRRLVQARLQRGVRCSAAPCTSLVLPDQFLGCTGVTAATWQSMLCAWVGNAGLGAHADSVQLGHGR